MVIISIMVSAAAAVRQMGIGTILVPLGLGLLVGVGAPIALTAVGAEVPIEMAVETATTVASLAG